MRCIFRCPAVKHVEMKLQMPSSGDRGRGRAEEDGQSHHLQFGDGGQKDVVRFVKGHVCKSALAVLGKLVNNFATASLNFLMTIANLELVPKRMLGAVQGRWTDQINFGTLKLPETGEVAVALVHRVVEGTAELRFWKNIRFIEFLIRKDDGFKPHRSGRLGNACRVVVVMPASIDQRLIDDVELCHWLPLPAVCR